MSMNFDSYWAEAWKVSSGTGAMDNAFREVAEKGWRARRNDGTA